LAAAAASHRKIYKPTVPLTFIIKIASHGKRHISTDPSAFCFKTASLRKTHESTVSLTLFSNIAADLAPVDILLLLASSEGDAPKVFELIAAGANLDTKVSNRNTSRDFLRECFACRKQILSAGSQLPPRTVNILIDGLNPLLERLRWPCSRES